MSLEFLNDAANVILVGPTATCLSDTDAWGNALIKIMPQRIIRHY
jgi:hypothetical protein